MTSIILNGACGKMGNKVIEIVGISKNSFIIKAAVDSKNVETTKIKDIPTYSAFPEDIEADVIIDFSSPNALEGLLTFAKNKNMPIVIATTGYSKDQIEKIETASKEIPIFFSFNMSMGINLISNMARKSYRFLGGSFDIEIIEKHHNQKVDAPSGTAIMIADYINKEANGKYKYVYDRHSMNKKRENDEIGISSIRAGSIVGEHEIIFADDNEIISISHTANSKNVFASGALKAANFLKSKTPGIYDMNDLVNSF